MKRPRKAAARKLARSAAKNYGTALTIAAALAPRSKTAPKRKPRR
jgi:hypothetical protein